MFHKSFFPKSKNVSVVNPYHQHQMPKKALKTLVQKNQIKKKSRVVNKKGRNISMSGGGMLSKSSCTLGSMDRLARLKAAAISGTR